MTSRDLQHLFFPIYITIRMPMMGQPVVTLKLLLLGPQFGYLPNACKTWLVVKPDYWETANSMLEGKRIKITKDTPLIDSKLGGQRYLGAALGSQTFVESNVKEKVDKWVTELKDLCEIAKTEPQPAYTAFTVGLCKRCIYVMRIEDSSKHFPLVSTIGRLHPVVFPSPNSQKSLFHRSGAGKIQSANQIWRSSDFQPCGNVSI